MSIFLWIIMTYLLGVVVSWPFIWIIGKYVCPTKNIRDIKIIIITSLYSWFSVIAALIVFIFILIDRI